MADARPNWGARRIIAQFRPITKNESRITHGFSFRYLLFVIRYYRDEHANEPRSLRGDRTCHAVAGWRNDPGSGRARNASGAAAGVHTINPIHATVTRAIEDAGDAGTRPESVRV